MKQLLVLAAAGWLVAAAPAGPAAHGVADLGWMSGRWQEENGGRWTEEVWLAPRGGMMAGLSRSGRGDRVGEYEYLRLEAGADGVPVYWASPGGQAAVGFRLVASDGRSASFENRAHDYPQLIRYRRDGARLVATISAADGSRPMSWTYRRID